MTIESFTAEKLYYWLTHGEDMRVLDVRNEVEFGRFKVEGPYPFEMTNVPYMEFIEHEAESVAKVPRDRPLRIVCAKEGSSRYVGEILAKHGLTDLASLLVGIKAWGNLLAPVPVAQTDSYELYQFQRPGKASCSYGLVCGKEMWVFDPAKNIAAYQAFAEQRGCTITRSFETHRQADYISGSLGLMRTGGTEILAPQPDFAEAQFAYTQVKDDDTYVFQSPGPETKAIHTPGHTPGSTSYLIDGRFLISGDTVFIISIGRPDLGGMAEEWSRLLFQTIKEKILPLDPAIQVLPGHYMDWQEADEQLIFQAALGDIIENNSHIYGIDNQEAFYAFIKANMRQQPEEYARIREINAGLVEVDEEEQDILDLGKNECAASAMAQSA